MEGDNPGIVVFSVISMCIIIIILFFAIGVRFASALCAVVLAVVVVVVVRSQVVGGEYTSNEPGAVAHGS